ncbi:hypothetical protein MBLNU457_g0729t1 [Dothideomycetes sp. NU457]
MSTLTSSAINKSGKTVAPKAAPRRRPGRAPPVQASTQGTDRAIADSAPTATESATTSADQLATPPPTQPSQPAQATQPTQADESIQATHGAEETEPPQATQPAEEQLEAPSGPLSQPPEVTYPTASEPSRAAQTQSEIQEAHRAISKEPQTGRERSSEDVIGAEVQAQEVQTGLSSSAQTPNAAADNSGVQAEAVIQPSRAPRAPTAGQKRKRNQPVAQPLTRPEEGTQDVTEEPAQEQQVIAGAEATTEAQQPATDSTSALAAKPPRKRQRKQQLSDERITEDDDDQVERAPTDTVAPIKKPRAKRKTKEVVPSVEGADVGDNVDGESGAAVVKPKRQRKRKQVTAPVVTEAERAEGEEQEEEDIEDPELHEIDINTTTMASLTRDRAVGKTSERGKKMAAIDWGEVVRKRREETHLPAPTGGDSAQTGEGQQGGEPTPNTEPQYRGLQLRMVNGEMVLDEESTRIDRQAEALEDANNRAQLETEDDLTNKITRMTWLEKKKRDPADRVPVYKMKSDPWSDEETDRFYEALSMFGTDFFIISKMFPPKTRRQIKLKFVREERLDGPRITRALSGDGSKPMDLSVYAEATGQEVGDFRDPEELARELELEGQEQRVEIEKKKVELAEAQKQRDIQMQARDKEKEERERQKQASKDQRALARQRKRRGIVGTGTF